MLANMKIGTKILAAFGIVLAVVGALALVAYRGNGRLTDLVENYGTRKVPGVNALWLIRQAETGVRADAGVMANAAASAALRADAEQRFAAAVARVAKGEKDYAALPHGKKTTALFEAYQPVARTWLAAAARFSETYQALQRAGGSHEALRATLQRDYESLIGTAVPVADAVKQLLAQTDEDAAALLEEAHATEASVEVVLAGTVALIIALLVALGLVLSRTIAGSIRGVVEESGRLREAVANGQLSTRGDVGKVGPEFRPIVSGINETMDAFQAPIRMTVESVSAIGKGAIPPRITDEYRGDFDLIKASLNACIDAVNALVADAGALARAGVEGRLATRADASKHHGDFRKVVQGVNDTLDAVINPLNVAARYVDQISRGQIPEKITASYAGDFNAIKDNLNRCIDAVNKLVSDAGTLAKAGVEGRLATRADASRHEGDFRRIVQGVNDTLDAVVGPLNVAAGYVERISRGEIPPPITDAYAGDFAKIKDNLNTCIAAVNLLVQDADALVQAAVTGRLSTRADASRHQGDFRKIVEGVNRTLDAVIAPVNESSRVLEQLSRRDLRARVDGQYQGDHARMKESVNATALALHDALAQVAQAVDQVSSASAQIASSSQAVASGASEQASSLEETTASIESVASMTKQTADSAAQANQLAQRAQGAATEGAAAVQQMQGAMGKIKTSAEGTSQIIRDINDIAFQTNLLALNAAVEAARAGEAGRGFAVVAEEVRSLALRAKEAATKTEELIRQSVKEANDGEVTAKHVAGKLGEISEGVTKVTSIVAEIAAAAKEQANGIEQVTKAVSEMDKVTQQNAASAEESSSAASELSGQSEELAAMVAAFQLNRQGHANVAAAPRARVRAQAPARPPASHAPALPASPAAHVADTFPMEDEPALRDF